jgi:hypothetical protein
VELLAFSSGTILEMYQKFLGSAVIDVCDKLALINSIRMISLITATANGDPEWDSFCQKLWNSETTVTCVYDVDPHCSGFRIIGALVRVGFIPGFSVAANSVLTASAGLDANRVNAPLVWGASGGIAGLPLRRSSGSSPEMLEIRAEIVRAILSVLSGPLFQSITAYRAHMPLFNSLIISGDFLHTADLFLSLLMSVLDLKTGRQSLPIFASAQFPFEERLASCCLDLINVLLDSPGDDNVFREIFSNSIEGKEEMEVFAHRLRDKITSIYSIDASLSISSTLRMKNESSFILFIFNFFSQQEKADHFLRVAKREWCKDLVQALLALIVAHANQHPQGVGILNACSFVMLFLSANRDCAVEVFNSSDNPSLGDTVTETLLKLLPGQADSLSEMWLSIICNLSAFMGGFSLSCSTLLVNITDKLAKKRNNTLTHLLLETIDNCLHYQYAKNSNLVYALLLRAPPEERSSESIRRLLEYLQPRVEDACKSREADHTEVLAFIRATSVVGILPLPRAIVIRQLRLTDQTRAWFSSFLWGTVFTNMQSANAARFDWKKIRIVTLSETPS